MQLDYRLLRPTEDEDAGAPLAGVSHAWRFDNANAIMTDQIGVLDLSRFGTPAVANVGPGGEPVTVFNSVGDYYNWGPSVRIIDYFDDWSMLIWLLMDAFSSTANWVVNQRGNAANTEYMQLFTSPNVIAVDLYDSASATKRAEYRPADIPGHPTGQLSTGVWYSVFVVHDNDTLRMFVNGEPGTMEASNALGTQSTGVASWRAADAAWAAANSTRHPGKIGPNAFWPVAGNQANAAHYWNNGDAFIYPDDE